MQTLASVAENLPQPMFPLPAFPAGWTSLVGALLTETAKHPNDPILTDTTGAKQTRSEVVSASVALARVLSQIVGDSKYVGVIMPPLVGGADVNVALALLGKVAVNLNYGTKTEIVNYAIDKCGITHVVAAPLLLAKTGIQPKGTLVTPEQLSTAITDEVKGWVRQVLTGPKSELPQHLPGVLSTLTDVATILFTTGSTGMPKGTVLDHKSILANMLSIEERFGFALDEHILGSAPLFHALGFTGTVWTPLILGKKVAYHPNNLDIKRICELVATEKLTLVLTPPSLMRKYLAKATREQFASVRHLVLGAEKVKPALRASVKEQLGIDVEEVYGATEFGPLITANVNREITLPSGKQVWGNRAGSAGLPVAGVTLQIRDMETGAVLPAGEAHQGQIWAHGPQCMAGYLDDPEKTAKVLVNGWYRTGDVGYVDEDGFLFITAREARFAKIAGEMVPMETVEQTIIGITGGDELSVHVTNIPDNSRGEKLVVFYTPMAMTPAELCAALKEQLPPLWVPGNRDFIAIEKLPLGSTNKIDMQALKLQAIAELGETE